MLFQFIEVVQDDVENDDQNHQQTNDYGGNKDHLDNHEILPNYQIYGENHTAIMRRRIMIK